MGVFNNVYNSKFWKPDNRWFFQLILSCFMHICIIKVKKSMDFLVGVKKPRGALWIEYGCYQTFLPPKLV